MSPARFWIALGAALALASLAWVLVPLLSSGERGAGLDQEPQREEQLTGAQLALLESTRAVGDGASAEQSSERAPVDEPALASALPVPGPSRSNAPLIVAGRVLDNSSQPVPGAEIQIEGGLSLSRASSRMSWNSSGWRPLRSDAEGRFELRAQPRGYEKLRLRVLTQDFVETYSQTFTRGERELTIVLSRAASLSGTLLLDEFVPQRRLVVQLGSEDGRTWRRAPLSDGAFEWLGLRPGPHSFRISVDTHIATLLELEGIEVLPGEVSEAPRLQSIDLRGRLRFFELRVLGTSGRQLANYAVTVHDRSGASLGWFDGKTSALQFLTSVTQPLSFVVTAPGYRTARRADLLEDHTLMLEPGIPLDVRVLGSERVPAPWGLQLAATRELVEGRSETAFQDVDVSGSLRMLLPEEGGYRLRARLSHPRDDVLVSLDELLEGTPLRAVLQVGAAGRELELELPGSALERALAESP